MEGYTIKITGKSHEEINEIESLRKEVFHIKEIAPNRYEKQIRDNVIIAFSLWKEDELIGGCYVGSNFDSLYVYFLFIKEKYQKNGLKLGRRLLSEILDHKNAVEELLDKSFDKSTLHPISEEVKKVYKAIGYVESVKGLMTRCI